MLEEQKSSYYEQLKKALDRIYGDKVPICKPEELIEFHKELFEQKLQ